MVPGSGVGRKKVRNQEGVSQQQVSEERIVVTSGCGINQKLKLWGNGGVNGVGAASGACPKIRYPGSIRVGDTGDNQDKSGKSNRAKKLTRW